MSGEVVTRLKRAYHNEVAERGGDDEAERLVSGWLAPISYGACFALVADYERLLSVETAARNYRRHEQAEPLLVDMAWSGWRVRLAELERELDVALAGATA